MKSNHETRQLNTLRKKFIEETKQFFSAIEQGESVNQLEKRHNSIQELGHLINQRATNDPAASNRSGISFTR
jgi:hypothetical protein